MVCAHGSQLVGTGRTLIAIAATARSVLTTIASTVAVRVASPIAIALGVRRTLAVTL
jgi:hypothetical protein